MYADDGYGVSYPPTAELNQDGFEIRRFHISFEQVFSGGPSAIEVDGSGDPTTPQEARLRNGTKSVVWAKTGRQTVEAQWLEDEIYPGAEIEKAYVGRIPIMLRSNFCVINNVSLDTQYEIWRMPIGHGMHRTGLLSRNDFDLSDHSRGGHFIINGSEKVLIAQERMAANFVYAAKMSVQERPIIRGQNKVVNTLDLDSRFESVRPFPGCALMFSLATYVGLVQANSRRESSQYLVII
ncbi:hypothetical protein QFC22_001760 [Naganishia vaughanmartiniae]|uniref:Uncharacterized protein n=1 Tax=Naganishia vaughanmartiniae TaxID=1424756 RepID=A0ACC2XG33_9TREE|nr:hypothetical protein QFC22_001760 [Naganishia vaughanmartiniae]